MRLNPIVVISLFIVLLSGCSRHRLSIHDLGEIEFRRSYNGHESMSKIELDKLAKANPVIVFPGDENLHKILLNSALISGEYLLIEKLKLSPSNDFAVNNTSGQVLKGIISYDDKSGKNILTVSDEKESASIQVNDRKAFEKIQVTRINIIPGGFEEIVIVEEYYFMNGDSFDLHVYEIR